MGEDLSTGAKIGITLIILCSLIAVVFSLLTMMKNITNTGAAQLQGSLDQMMSSSFDDYNQKTVTGTQVLAALKLFEGQDVGIVIKTTLAESSATAEAGPLGGYNYGARLAGYTETGSDDFTKTYGTNYFSKSQVEIAASKFGKGIVPTYAPGTPTKEGDAGLVLDSSGSFYVGQYYHEGGSPQVLFNMNTRPTTASGTPSYVRTSARFRALLIKDASGTNIGVCFTEIATN